MSTATGQDVIRVPAARARYLGGAMSLRWWYKQVELGRLPHHRAGSAVLLRVADVEAFVAKTFRDEVKQDEAAPEPAPSDAGNASPSPGSSSRPTSWLSTTQAGRPAPAVR